MVCRLCITKRVTGVGRIEDRGNRTAFHKDMANMGFVVTELLMNEPLQDLSAYRGRLLHYKRG